MLNMTATSVSEIMTPHPVTVPPGTSIAETARWMRDADIGNVIVADGAGIHGILTDRDIVVRAIADDRGPTEVSAGDICTADPVTINLDDSVEQALQVMRERAVRRLPVVSNGRIVGLVSLGDLAIEEEQGGALADISAAEPNL